MPEVNNQQFSQARLPGIEPGPIKPAEKVDYHQQMDDYYKDVHRNMWKMNPNQQAIPGTEHLSHPGAKVLAQDPKMFFKFGDLPWGGYRMQNISLVRGNSDRVRSSLLWSLENRRRIQNEILGAETNESDQGKGYATALYGIGRQLTNEPPEHSNILTGPGRIFAHSSSARYGGFVPPPFEDEMESIDADRSEGRDYDTPHPSRRSAFKSGEQTPNPDMRFTL